MHLYTLASTVDAYFGWVIKQRNTLQCQFQKHMFMIGRLENKTTQKIMLKSPADLVIKNIQINIKNPEIICQNFLLGTELWYKGC